jgi:hypothetical protein
MDAERMTTRQHGAANSKLAQPIKVLAEEQALFGMSRPELSFLASEADNLLQEPHADEDASAFESGFVCAGAPG